MKLVRLCLSVIPLIGLALNGCIALGAWVYEEPSAFRVTRPRNRVATFRMPGHSSLPGEFDPRPVVAPPPSTPPTAIPPDKEPKP